ncbi:Asp23/Gls24 family envelope stress response protein [Staphylococcus hominis]|uniref:Asp23/Gls24 family envelope stress response protein n=1 Tax=Staphylococcus hominis TaxID=1290 RepID=UPI001F58BAC3|nr:Asp23/Gls24 family envelope stress response protein [Staphylococcus hominis]MCI2868824.1 Asp23/Gls24 family envelope stress response protein [Staphylococcus hominis]MDS3893208.1 Asp23/Gls24 family envelope stress response protein [Staphylococcus hominis]
MVNVADYSHANLGKVEIVPEVISVIASIAVSEVEGVTGHFYELKKSNIEKISRKNLKVNTKDDGIHIDVYCSIKHGIKIAKVASKIQTSIFNSIKTMTAIEPKEINIHIMHITIE